tara:strand:- start:1773 stop:2123 length:351 start_codon:yes stop_codon:yes gene_type:complete
MIRVSIPGRFPTLNQYRNWNHWQHSKQKNTFSESIELALIAFKVKDVSIPMILNVTAYTTRMRDVDNCVIAAKYFLDVLKKQGLIPDDNPKYVKSLILQWKKAKSFKDEKTVFIIQ